LAPDGCPWDREQTPRSLCNYLIEEAHEVVEAIEQDDHEHLREELGDVLLQVVFHAELARAQGHFAVDDVIAAICDKLVRRHPHVFGDQQVSGAAEVVDRWEAIKATERGTSRGALDGVPASLPALMRAQRMGEKASRIGFDWPDGEGARRKLDEELAELDAAVAAGDEEAASQELGDVLFALANFARKRGLDAEASLRGTLGRFAGRVREVERLADEQGADLGEMSEAELDALWVQAKATERKS